MNRMRMRLTLLVALLLGSLAATAQPIYTGLDTIVGRHEKYYLPEWYDTCPSYFGGTNHYHSIFSGTQYVQSNWSDLPWPFQYNNVRIGNRYYATNRMAVKGIVGMTYIDAKQLYSEDLLRCFPPNLTQKLPEYFYLMQQVAVAPVPWRAYVMEVLDSVRWVCMPTKPTLMNPSLLTRPSTAWQDPKIVH